MRQPPKQPEKPAEPGAPKLLLTVAEACAALGIGRNRLYRLLFVDAPAGLRSVKVGRKRLIPLRECERWVRDTFAEQVGDDLPPAA